MVGTTIGWAGGCVGRGAISGAGNGANVGTALSGPVGVGSTNAGTGGGGARVGAACIAGLGADVGKTSAGPPAAGCSGPPPPAPGEAWGRGSEKPPPAEGRSGLVVWAGAASGEGESAGVGDTAAGGVVGRGVGVESVQALATSRMSAATVGIREIARRRCMVSLEKS